MADKAIKKAEPKAMLKKLANSNTKMRWHDRKKIEITEDTKHYKKGETYNPHVTWADHCIEQGFAKAI